MVALLGLVFPFIVLLSCPLGFFLYIPAPRVFTRIFRRSHFFVYSGTSVFVLSFSFSTYLRTALQECIFSLIVLGSVFICSCADFGLHYLSVVFSLIVPILVFAYHAGSLF